MSSKARPVTTLNRTVSRFRQSPLTILESNFSICGLLSDRNRAQRADNFSTFGRSHVFDKSLGEPLGFTKRNQATLTEIFVFRGFRGIWRRIDAIDRHSFDMLEFSKTRPQVRNPHGSRSFIERGYNFAAADQRTGVGRDRHVLKASHFFPKRLRVVVIALARENQNFCVVTAKLLPRFDLAAKDLADLRVAEIADRDRLVKNDTRHRTRNRKIQQFSHFSLSQRARDETDM